MVFRPSGHPTGTPLWVRLLAYSEWEYLMGSVTTLRKQQHPPWPEAVGRFLSTRDLSATTIRIYTLTLERVGTFLPTTDLHDLDPDAVATALILAYPVAAPATWNRHVATLRSFLAYTTRQGWTASGLTDTLDRRREVTDHTRSLARADLNALLNRKDIPVRERCLWRMLYETAARTQEILNLNIEDLDLSGRRARTIRKGGAIDTVHWASSTARVLPYVINGRTTGPLFLSTRPIQSRRAPAATDIDPTTGLARLSYARAAQIFTTTTGGLTLHQLRHSALTHLSEDGVPLPLLMAKSRHESLKTLQRYVRPSTEAVAALTAAHDTRRRK